MEEQPVPQRNPRMFEPDRELVLPATPSMTANNLSVLYFETMFKTYACYFSKNLVFLMSWDLQMEQVTMETLPLKESGKGKALTVMQCRITVPANRTMPILVVATVLNVMLFDVKSLKILASTPIDSTDDYAGRNYGYRFARGITCVENFVVIGTYTGDLLIFTCTGETSFNVKTCSEHKAAISDISTCTYDLITVSCDVMGNVAVWNKNMKTVTKRISTGHQISVINILRRQAFCGTYYGQVLVYSVQNGSQLAELNIHFRQITSLSVAPESAYILTASEDGYIRIWKLHSRKPAAYQVEYRYAEKSGDNIIVGAQFLNGRGNGYAFLMFERNKLPIYLIKRHGGG